MDVSDGCAACGTELRANARFCDSCGSPVARPSGPAEYKQVTVLFADVVHSMDLAAAVGAERLREIMAELFDRSSAVVKRYGGTVDKFTGDGIMAVFGAPMTLENHAIRACIAALDIQDQTNALATTVLNRDGVVLQLPRQCTVSDGPVGSNTNGSGIRVARHHLAAIEHVDGRSSR